MKVTFKYNEAYQYRTFHTFIPILWIVITVYKFNVQVFAETLVFLRQIIAATYNDVR